MTTLGNLERTENKDAPKDEGKGGAPAGGDDAAKKAAAEAEAKAAQEAAAKPFGDVKQLKVPDGVKLDEARMKGFLEIAKKAGLTAAQAQHIFDLDLSTAKALAEETKAAHEAASKKAVETLKADKEIGGANFEASMKHAHRAIAKYGADGLKEALETVQLADGSMLGDSVVMGRLLVRIGKSLREDSLGDTTKEPKSKPAPNEAAALGKGLYPKTPQLT